MMHVGFVAVHMALLAGASAEDGPVTVRLDGQANHRESPVLHVRLSRRGEDLGTIHVRFPETIESTHRASGLPLPTAGCESVVSDHATFRPRCEARPQHHLAVSAALPG